MPTPGAAPDPAAAASMAISTTIAIKTIMMATAAAASVVAVVVPESVPLPGRGCEPIPRVMLTLGSAAPVLSWALTWTGGTMASPTIELLGWVTKIRNVLVDGGTATVGVLVGSLVLAACATTTGATKVLTIVVIVDTSTLLPRKVTSPVSPGASSNVALLILGFEMLGSEKFAGLSNDGLTIFVRSVFASSCLSSQLSPTGVE